MVINTNKAIKTKIIVRDNYNAGIFFIIISSICYALMAAMIKQVGHLPLMEMILFRSIPTMIIVPNISKKNEYFPFGQ